ncbi:AAA family ATPase [Variovorax soli]|uniref:Wobble nucleotide-excising tRNase n=1 Tax=Variovorax soli TaxID=376815 RepID=A0ABU1NN65_9BURK|nr:AAA family ATPase [Variovorax soli]MDR6539471.1 wobble nucleotide-excising tRNase [Variovorax soli]
MTLARISKIKGYRIFLDFNWPASLPDFARFNVVYGWNGAGKTTLSTLLRHVQLQQPLGEGSAEFVFGEARVPGSDLDKVPVPNVRVFNRDFVSRAIFESGSATLPPVYYFGEDSADKQRQIAELTELRNSQRSIQSGQTTTFNQATSERESFCSDQAKGIKNLLTVAGGGPYNNYNAATFKADAQRLAEMDPRPQRLTDEQRDAYLMTKDSRALAKLSRVSVLFPDLGDLRARTAAKLSVSVVSFVLDELTRDPVAAAWVNEGLALHRGNYLTDTCRFCAQPLPEDRVARLEAHFNDEFNHFKAEIKSLLNEVTHAQTFADSFTAPAKEALYEILRAEYSKTLAELRSHSTSLHSAMEALKQALFAKQDEPFRKIELETLLSQVGEVQGLGSLVLKVLAIAAEGAAFHASFAGRKSLEKLNDIIDQHNALTDSFDTAVKDARKALAQDEVIAAVDEWNVKCQAVEAAEKARDQARDASDELDKQIAALEAEVRQHHRPADELNSEMSAYLGRDELKFEAEQNGYRITRAGLPAMDLSDGERTAIAFLYFLKSLQGTDFALSDGVVVIDDPVSSLDANSLFSAFGFMKDRTANAKQLIVLTHNFTFFRLVRNWFDGLNGRRKPKQAHFYMLTPVAQDGRRGAKLGVLDPFLSDFESEYHYLFKRVYDASQLQQGQGLEQHYGMPNIARRLLETFLAYRVPHHSGDLYKKLNAVAGEVSTKTRILRFLHTFSHADAVAQPDPDPSILSETPAVLRDVLALVRANDAGHHDAMIELMVQREQHAQAQPAA